MNNKFILNETTGIGIIQDDNSNNTLFKTEGNEEEVREVLEKENEVENLENKMIDIENKKVNEKSNRVSIIMNIIITFILMLINTFIAINSSLAKDFFHLYYYGIMSFLQLGLFSLSIYRMGKIKEKINSLNNDFLEYEEEKEKLEEELEKLKSNTNITKMENINIKELNSIVSPKILFPQDNTQNIDTLINTGKAKTLRKEF